MSRNKKCGIRKEFCRQDQLLGDKRWAIGAKYSITFSQSITNWYMVAEISNFWWIHSQSITQTPDVSFSTPHILIPNPRHSFLTVLYMKMPFHFLGFLFSSSQTSGSHWLRNFRKREESVISLIFAIKKKQFFRYRWRYWQLSISLKDLRGMERHGQSFL